MDYGRKGARKRKEMLTSGSLAARHRGLALGLLILLVLVVGGIGYAGYRVYSYVKETIAAAPEITSIDATPSGYMSTVYDADGNVSAQLVGTGSNRVYVTLDEIPKDLQYAFVAIEDERFFDHNGIDIKGIIRAGMQGITTGTFSEGASTITQQLLKNNVFDGWTSETGSERVQRKIQEQYLAVELEKEVSKEWILENYLNTINLGQNTLGVQAASLRYFGKDVSELTLSECAVLAAITQNPSRYNPISHPEENGTRRQKVLENMLEQGYISKEAYEEALSDDVYSRISENNVEYENSPSNVTSYFVDALTEEVIEDLQTELGYTEAQAIKALYSGGLSIYSTQNPAIQSVCDTVVNENSNYEISSKVSFSYALTIQKEDGSLENYSQQTMLSWLKSEKGRDSLNYDSEEAAAAAIAEYKQYLLENGGTVIGENLTYTVQPQVSMTIIDQSTGQVMALVGGRGEKTASQTLNRAADSTMQPGSTFKIITTYAPALEEGVVSLATGVVDEPITYADGKVVRNADGRYRGYTTIRDAITDSVNVVAVKTSRMVTLEKCFQSALDFGITTLEKDTDMVEALPLGGITDGVTNVELTAAFATIANGGVYQEPVYYTKILDHDGNVLLEKQSETHRVIQDTTAFLLTSAMQDVVTEGTGRLANFSGMSVAGKTGTTTSTRASWFVGYTPYYTCAIWGGYDDNSELESTRFTRVIWREAMSRIHEGLEDTGFTQPEGITRCTVCSVSGKLAVEGVCSEVHTEYFAGNDAPSEMCDIHQKARICTVSGKLASQYCPEELCEERVFVKNAANGEEMLPTETCDIHTSNGLITDILQNLQQGISGTGEQNGDEGTSAAPAP